MGVDNDDNDVHPTMEGGGHVNMNGLYVGDCVGLLVIVVMTVVTVLIGGVSLSLSLLGRGNVIAAGLLLLVLELGNGSHVKCSRSCKSP